MKEKIVPFGETHPVYVLESSKSMIVVHATDVGEGFVLVGHGISDLPAKETKGKIVFEKGGPMGGYWKFYPDTI